jgi:glucose-6-phosphate isomerase
MLSVCALITWSIVVVQCALVPMAYASPPDPTYLAGIWDNADYDEIIILVTSASGSTDTTHHASELIRPLVVVAAILPGENALLSAALLSLQPSRAPPAQ